MAPRHSPTPFLSPHETALATNPEEARGPHCVVRSMPSARPNPLRTVRPASHHPPHPTRRQPCKSASAPIGCYNAFDLQKMDRRTSLCARKADRHDGLPFRFTPSFLLGCRKRSTAASRWNFPQPAVAASENRDDANPHNESRNDARALSPRSPELRRSKTAAGSGRKSAARHGAPGFVAGFDGKPP